MGYSSSVYKSAADKLAERRLAAEKQADARRSEIYARDPRARELEQAIASCGTAAVRAVLNGGDVAAEMTKLKEKNLALQQELRALLVGYGYSENALEPQYACEKCNDTGYCEQQGRTVMCTCLKQQLVACACEEFNRIVPLQLSTFESFCLDYYSKTVDPATGIAPYYHMEKIEKFCKAYAQGFTPQAQSILMKGATGLGKTHLSLAIANEVIRRGYGV
ncbi:MAG: ATP-binding protein, partial [Ruminococcus sp.]|nr:ATP-binding protein [Ruminococcus sp.]